MLSDRTGFLLGIQQSWFKELGDGGGIMRVFFCFSEKVKAEVEFVRTLEFTLKRAAEADT